jgi:hypothetical protein
MERIDALVVPVYIEKKQRPLTLSDPLPFLAVGWYFFTYWVEL